MPRSGFFNKFPEQSIFREKLIDFLQWLCFVRSLLLQFFAFFYIVTSDLGESIVSCSRPCRPLAEIKEFRFKGKTYFLEITMFLGQKLNQTGTDLKLQIFSLIIRSHVISIKYRFDQVSFRSSVVRSNVVAPSIGDPVMILDQTTWL